MNRRDKLLQEMGIVQWQLKRPEILKGSVNITAEKNIRLIIISEQPILKEQALLQDIFRSLDLAKEDCLCINFDFLPYLHVEHQVNYWLLTENQSKIDRTLSNRQYVHCWKTSNLEKLKQNPHEKRYFWQQVQGA